MVYLPLGLPTEKLRSSIAGCAKMLDKREVELQRREERVRDSELQRREVGVHQRELELLNEREGSLLRREEAVRQREMQLMANESKGQMVATGGEQIARTVKKIANGVSLAEQLSRIKANANKHNGEGVAPNGKRIKPAVKKVVNWPSVEVIDVDSPSAVPVARSKARPARSTALARTAPEPRIDGRVRQGKVAKPRAKLVKRQKKPMKIIRAYNLFSKTRLAELGVQGVKQGAAFKQLGAEWKAMPPAQKANWEAQAEEANRQRSPEEVGMDV